MYQNLCIYAFPGGYVTTEAVAPLINLKCFNKKSTAVPMCASPGVFY